MKANRTPKAIRSFSTTLLPLLITLAIVLIQWGTLSPAQAQEFKFGCVQCVTGPIPQYGEYFIRGSQLALEDLQKSGWINGKKMRIVLEDGKNDPKISLACLNKMINIDKVPIFCTSGSSVVLALGPVAQKNSTILVNTAAQNPNVRKLGNFIFSLVPLADRVMEKTTEHAIKRMKAKTAAILHVNNEYGRGVAETFKKLFEDLGGNIAAVEIHAQGETDFTAHLTKLKFTNTDIIFFVGHENELGYSIKKAKQLGVKTPWLAPPGGF